MGIKKTFQFKIKYETNKTNRLGKTYTIGVKIVVVFEHKGDYRKALD